MIGSTLTDGPTLRPWPSSSVARSFIGRRAESQQVKADVPVARKSLDALTSDYPPGHQPFLINYAKTERQRLNISPNSSERRSIVKLKSATFTLHTHYSDIIIYTYRPQNQERRQSPTQWFSFILA